MLFQMRCQSRKDMKGRAGSLKANGRGRPESGRWRKPGAMSERTAALARYTLNMLKPTAKIWHNGRLIDWNDAKIHVLAHVTSYGSSVFEGIRCYATSSGPAIFRVREHIRRLLDSAKIYHIEVKHTVDELANAMTELVRVNKLES